MTCSTTEPSRPSSPPDYEVLGEGLEPPQTLRSSGLQPEAIAATRTQRVLILSDFNLSRRRDSDSRLAVYKTATLPLSYFGKLSFTRSRASKPNFIKFGKKALGQNSPYGLPLKLRRRSLYFTKIKLKKKE
jgi:hypothetical protein